MQNMIELDFSLSFSKLCIYELMELFGSRKVSWQQNESQKSASRQVTEVGQNLGSHPWQKEALELESAPWSGKYQAEFNTADLKRYLIRYTCRRRARLWCCPHNVTVPVRDTVVREKDHDIYNFIKAVSAPNPTAEFCNHAYY